MAVTIHSVVHASVLDPEGLLRGFGSAAFAVALAILVIECGVIFGAVLPGDSLLFIVGVLIANGFIPVSVWVALPVLVVAAFAGNLIGYWTGAKIGPALFRRPDSRIFKREYVDRTQVFFDKHGTRAIVLARFVPIVRSIITSAAGIARMNYRVFATYSGIGAVAWVIAMTLGGYYLGNVTVIREHVDVVTLVIIALSLVPVFFESLRHRNRS